MSTKNKIILTLLLSLIILSLNFKNAKAEEVAVFYENEKGEVVVEFHNEDKEKVDGLKIEYTRSISTKNNIYSKLKVLAGTNQRTNRNKKLENISKIKSITSTDIVPENWSQGSYIIINTDKLILTYYKDGKIIEKYPIAAGKLGKGKKTVTPNMSKKIINKAVNPYWNGMNRKYKPVKGGAPNNPLGKRWMGLDKEYGIHGTNNERSIGTFASHGCVRMFNADVNELFSNVSIGTTVIVGDEKYLKEMDIIQVEGEILYE